MLIKCRTSELEKDTSVQDITVRIASYFDEVIFKILLLLQNFRIFGMEHSCFFFSLLNLKEILIPAIFF